MKAGALLLLLAVAASQVDLSLSIEVFTMNISICPINFYGSEYTLINGTLLTNSLTVCFGNDPGNTPDCLSVGNIAPSSSVRKSITGHPTNLFSLGVSNCHVSFTVENSANNSTLILEMHQITFSTTFALILSKAPTAVISTTYVFNATVGGSTLESWLYNATDIMARNSKIIIACRHSGEAFLPNSVIGSCTDLECDSNAFIKNKTVCGSTEVCQGDNTCVPLTFVCTATGSAVMDFNGKLQPIPDRCAYKLMVLPTFELSAVLRERRRKDVLFLDHLILSTNGRKVVLGQGGRVWVDDKAVPLRTNIPHVLGGVSVVKDNTGVFVNLGSSNQLFFDGNIAHMSGFADNFTGLCGKPMDSYSMYSTSDQINANFSDPGCDTIFSDTMNSSINCNQTTERCNLLRQAPFTACHDDIDPEPYIQACVETLCSYPMVDALNCQFFEAYTKACSLRNITMDGWRSTVGCPARPQAFCLDRYCSDHEFCGEKLGGGTGCLCRALFASKYRGTNALGEPTVCMDNSATLTLAGCLLMEKGIDYSTLHLNDPSCTGDMDNQTHMVTFSFDSNDMCGTEIMTNSSQILYKNSIVLRNSTNSVITRSDQVQIDFSCLYKMPDIESVSFRIKDSSVVVKIISGVWNYTLMMSAYSDAGRTNLITPSTEIQLNQKIWMELKTEGLDDNMVAIVTDSCWATSDPQPNSSPKYDLIMNKCPSSADHTVNVVGNGLGTSNYFSFNAFQFTGEKGAVYLHCQVDLCPKHGPSCVPSCGNGYRKRRSIRSTYAGLITMAWSP